MLATNPTNKKYIVKKKTMDERKSLGRNFKYLILYHKNFSPKEKELLI
jgi:hypothetical protein